MKKDHQKVKTHLQRGKAKQPLALDAFPNMFSGQLEAMTGKAASVCDSERRAGSVLFLKLEASVLMPATTQGVKDMPESRVKAMLEMHYLGVEQNPVAETEEEEITKKLSMG